MRIGHAGYSVYGSFDNADGSVAVKTDDAVIRSGQNAVKPDGADRAEQDAGNGLNASDDSRRASENENVHNLVFDFKRENDYNLIGASSKLEDLDVEKALSDMKRDSVLSQYQFFIKSPKGLGTDEDGTVRKVVRNFNDN